MYKIAIPKPCFESWEQMTPDGNGRYCSSCAKTVIDFSVLSDEEVQQYFTSHYSNKICGHFKNVQPQRIVIELPQNIFRLQLPFWKQFLVILLLSYGGSFLGIDTSFANRNSFTQGEPVASYAPQKKRGSEEKKRKRKHVRKRIKYSLRQLEKFEPTFTMISGYTVIEQQQSVSLFPVDDSLPSDSPEKKGSSYSGNGTSSFNSGESTTNNTPPLPPKPVPANKDFILPAGFSTRRSLFSKKIK
jgi:hypothetical protein